MASGVEESEVTEEGPTLQIDTDTLLAAFAQSTDGTAHFVDADGNTHIVTAQQLADAGLIEFQTEGVDEVQLQNDIEPADQVLDENGEAVQYMIADEDGNLHPAPPEIVAEQIELNRQSTKSPELESKSPVRSSPRRGRQTRASASSSQSKVPPKKRGAHARSQKPVESPRTPSPVPPVSVEDEPTIDSPVEQPNNSTGQDDDLRAMLAQLQGDMAEKEKRLKDMEDKFNETTEQNMVIAQALVSSCNSEQIEVVFQGQEGEPEKRHIVSITPATETEGPQISMTLKEPESQGATLTEEKTTNSRKRKASGISNSKMDYKCKICKEQFPQEHHLKRHLELSHPTAATETFYCQHCEQSLTFPSKSHFDAHVRMTHGDEAADAQSAETSIYQCGACGKNFTETDDMMAHILSAHSQNDDSVANVTVTGEDESKTGLVSCKECSRQFISEAGLKKHELSHISLDVLPPGSRRNRFASGHPHRMYSCKMCSKTFTSLRVLDDHEKRAHIEDETGFSCHLCPKRFRFKDNLDDHVLWHKADAPYRCTQCSKTFVTANRLKAHETRHKDEQVAPKRDNICPICSRTFYERDVLAKHLKEHKEVIYPCPECDKKFTEEQYLRRHLIIHTGTKDNSCSICAKTFLRAEGLRAHRHLHTGLKPHRCDQCGMGFGTRWNLNNHLKLHSNVKPFMCDQCGRSFNLKSNLVMHTRTHTSTKPYQCSSCKKTFTRLAHLETHALAHAGTRPYQCLQCERAFYSTAHLNQHMQVHSADRPYQCASCGREFIRKAHLDRHLKVHTAEHDNQMVIVYESAGALSEAFILADGVSEPVTDGQIQSNSSAPIRGTPVAVPEAPAAKMESRSTNDVAPVSIEYENENQPEQQVQRLDEEGGSANFREVSIAEALKGAQLQFMDEEGNPTQVSIDRVTVLDNDQGALIHMPDGQNIQLDQASLEQLLAAQTAGVVEQQEEQVVQQQEIVAGEEVQYITEEQLRELEAQGMVVYQQSE